MLDQVKPVPFVQSDTDLVLRGGTANANELRTPLIYSDPELPAQTSRQEHLSTIPELGDGGLSEQSVQEEGSQDEHHARSTSAKTTRLKSDLEIRHQHYQKQKQYSEQRRQRRLTDIDFEGILSIIGGCSHWQVVVYLMISVQQVPHAMFNLSVVYMMYQPDHWCKIPFLTPKSFLNRTLPLIRGTMCSTHK